jgi:hypothetical protein
LWRRDGGGGVLRGADGDGAGEGAGGEGDGDPPPLQRDRTAKGRHFRSRRHLRSHNLRVRTGVWGGGVQVWHESPKKLRLQMQRPSRRQTPLPPHVTAGSHVGEGGGVSQVGGVRPGRQRSHAGPTKLRRQAHPRSERSQRPRPPQVEAAEQKITDVSLVVKYVVATGLEVATRRVKEVGSVRAKEQFDAAQEITDAGTEV